MTPTPQDVADLRAGAQALNAGRNDEAWALVEPLVARCPDFPEARYLEGVLRNSRGDFNGAEKAMAEAVRLRPAEGRFQAALGQLQAARRVGPDEWARAGAEAVQAGELDRAEASFREALTRSPGHPGAHEALAELIWMRTGDAAAAMAMIEARVAETSDEAIWWLRPKVLAFVGDDEAAADAAEAAAKIFGDKPNFQMLASQTAALADRPEASLSRAEAVWDASPGSPQALVARAQARLAAGEAEGALQDVRALKRLRPPGDQVVLALESVATRLVDGADAGVLNDYGLVRSYRLETPPGWSSLEAYLGDLKAALDARHFFRAAPFHQSVRGGSQTRGTLLDAPEPAIKAFFTAVGRSIDAHVAWLGRGDDPLRMRNTGRWTFDGAWSIRLRPNGRHVNHMHPGGWLSSAFYVHTPTEALAGDDHAGWIQFGEPGMVTRPKLGAGHFVRPEPGMLVLFPSWMWHGTVPFATDESRMTIAFDVVPK